VGSRRFRVRTARKETQFPKVISRISVRYSDIHADVFLDKIGGLVVSFSELGLYGSSWLV
jgi:hypothetical protein